MHRVLLLAFDGAQTLDVTGPAEVFAAAGRARADARYDVRLLSVRGRPISTSSGLSIATAKLSGVRPSAGDTVIVAGGDEPAITAALRDGGLTDFLRRAARCVRRIGSVCSGAFLLAHAGVLDGKRAATHWSACDRLASFRPGVTVDENAIFVTDGRVWTSAGVTTGIDMALAMVEEDLGGEVPDAVAARLVLYARRPGFQSQFSEALVAQTSTGSTLRPAIDWARVRLAAVDVPALAKAAGLSVRTLHRRCAEELRTTPAKLIERLRVEHARTLLATSERPIKAVAADCGFGPDERMRRAFERELGVGPRDYRMLFDRCGRSAREPLTPAAAGRATSSGRAADRPPRRSRLR